MAIEVPPPIYFAPVFWKGSSHERNLDKAFLPVGVLGIRPEEQLQLVHLPWNEGINIKASSKENEVEVGKERERKKKKKKKKKKK